MAPASQQVQRHAERAAARLDIVMSGQAWNGLECAVGRLHALGADLAFLRPRQHAPWRASQLDLLARSICSHT